MRGDDGNGDEVKDINKNQLGSSSSATLKSKI